MSNTIIKGQCLCGAVQYQYSAEIEKSILCYCQDCQQAQGSIAGWNSPIEKINFELSGIEYLQEYFHTANKARVFCKVCASPLYSYRLDLPEFIRLRLGTVTEGNIPAPTEEYFIEHKPEFIVISSS